MVDTQPPSAFAFTEEYLRQYMPRLVYGSIALAEILVTLVTWTLGLGVESVAVAECLVWILVFGHCMRDFSEMIATGVMTNTQVYFYSAFSAISVCFLAFPVFLLLFWVFK